MTKRIAAVVVVVVLVVGGNSAAWGTTPVTSSPCELGVSLLHSNSTFFPKCKSNQGVLFSDWDRCLDPEFPSLRWRNVYKPNPQTPNFWNNSQWQFNDPSNAHENVHLRVLLWDDAPGPRWEFTAEWWESLNGADLHYLVARADTMQVLLNHGEPVEEGAGRCAPGRMCSKTWTSHIMNVPWHVPMVAAMRFNKKNVPGEKGQSQFRYAVCREGCCLGEPTVAEGWTAILLMPLTLVLLRRSFKGPPWFLVALLLVPLATEAEAKLKVKRNPEITVRAHGKAPDHFEAQPGLWVTKGKKLADGGCQLTEGIEIRTGNETHLGGHLSVDYEDCTVRVGAVEATELEPEGQPQAEGSAEGGTGPFCFRQMWNRTTLTLELFQDIIAFLALPVFLDFTRMDRVGAGFSAVDNGEVLFCDVTSFFHFATALSFMGWDKVPNAFEEIGLPDLTYDATGHSNADGEHPLIYGDWWPNTDYYNCAILRVSGFNYVGSPYIIGLPAPAFGHGLVAGCLMGPGGNYDCVHYITPDSILPAQHVSIFPLGNVVGQETVTVPYFARLTWEGSVKYIDYAGGFCPLHFIQPPQPWQ